MIDLYWRLWYVSCVWFRFIFLVVGFTACMSMNSDHHRAPYCNHFPSSSLTLAPNAALNFFPALVKYKEHLIPQGLMVLVIGLRDLFGLRRMTDCPTLNLGLLVSTVLVYGAARSGSHWPCLCGYHTTVQVIVFLSYYYWYCFLI